LLRTARPTPFPYTTLFRSVPPLFQKHLPMLPERFPPVEGRVVDHVFDRLEREAQFPVEQDLLQHIQVVFGIEAIPRFARLRRRQDRKSTRLNSSHVKISYA